MSDKPKNKAFELMKLAMERPNVPLATVIEELKKTDKRWFVMVPTERFAEISMLLCDDPLIHLYSSPDMPVDDWMVLPIKAPPIVLPIPEDEN